MKLSSKNNKLELQLSETKLTEYGSLENELDSSGYRFDFEAYDEGFYDLGLDELSGDKFIDELILTTTIQDKIYPYAFLIKIGRQGEKINLNFSVDYSTDSWGELINLDLFYQSFQDELNKNGIKADAHKDEEHLYYSLTFDLWTDLSTNFGSLLENYLRKLANIHRQTSDRLLFNEGFVSQFRFPEEFQHTFTQYLMYFGKFLEDLGVDGDISVRENSGLTSLNFLPEDKDIALENISAALSSYLALPESSNISIIKPQNSLEAQIRFQQLMSTVSHLQSQLKLSEAMISLKDAELSVLKKQNTEAVIQKQPSTDISEYWEPREGIKIPKNYKGKFLEIDFTSLMDSFKKAKK